MTGLWIGLSIVRSFADVQQMFARWFPSLPTAGNYDQLLEDSGEWPSLVISVHAMRGEFPTLVSVELFPGPQEESYVMPVMIELARRFAEELKCRTVCDGSGYGDTDSPNWVIVWDNGISYLSDDCNTPFADGASATASGEIKIVREIDLPRIKLDERGAWVRPGSPSRDGSQC